MVDLENQLWEEFLAEARKFYPRIEASDNLKQHIRNHTGAGIASIGSLPDGPDRTAAVAGATVCVRSAGYISAMVARAEPEQVNARTLTLSVSAYDQAFVIVKDIFHGIVGDRICD
ncbi:MAG: hypothetical protein RQ899_14890 [Pseudomonadales bacterium]|nr:hypothetical protein [Pseudomonadales bacterium]